MRSAFAVIASCALCLSACAGLQGESQSGRFEFALIGDMPYDGQQEKEFPNVMGEIDAAELAFVVHNSDFWWDGQAWTEKAGSLPPCADETGQALTMKFTIFRSAPRRAL